MAALCVHITGNSVQVCNFMAEGALTLNLLTTTIVAPPSNASKWQMGFNSAFKGLNTAKIVYCVR